MEKKLKELIGKPSVWLYVTSSNGWIKDVEILDVTPEIVTFRYEHESDTERKVWEKTTRIENIAEVEIRLLAIPKDTQQVTDIKNRLSRLLDQD
ncbi:MAG: DUF6679 family protein [Synechococcales bacterium]|nr:DUF6679 family protein [Synechococcales bacterium]